MYNKNYSNLAEMNLQHSNKYKDDNHTEKEINYNDNNKKDTNKIFNKALTIISYNLLEYLTKDEKQNLKLVNKHVMDIIDCEELFKTSINSLSKLFYKENLFEDEDLKNKPPEKKSKFKEKFTFNKSLNELYKHSEEKFALNKSLSEFYKHKEEKIEDKIPNIMKKTRK